METNGTLRKNIRKCAQGILGFLSSAVCMMGYYPLLPAYFAANCLIHERSLLLYIGMMVGMGYFMPLEMIMKYIFVLIIIAIAIRFYLWANRKCGGFMAGLIAGLTTIAMNFSGNAFASADRRELLLGISEGVLVLGLTVLIHYLIGMIAAVRFPVLGQEHGNVEMPAGEGKLYDPEGRMAAFATAVDGLSAAFASMGAVKEKNALEDVGALEQEVTGKLCAACDGCAICWNENSIHISGKIRAMLQAVVEHQPKEEIVKQEYVQGCPRYPNMVEEAVHAFSRMELNQAWYKRLLENRLVIAQQLDAMAGLMEDWAKGNHNLDAKSRVLIAKIAYEVKEKGLVAEDIHIYEDENKRRYIKAKVASKWGGGIPSRNYVRALEKAMHIPLRLELNARAILTKDPVSLTVYEDTVFYTLPGIAAQKKSSSPVSGDNFAMFSLDDGRYFVCLSDGMGSGSQASQESELVVELFQKFMEAGFQKDTAIQMMNSAMVLQGEDHSYSTLDLADIDLYSGKLDLIKIGAAAAFLKHGEEVECISSSSLPTGVDVNLQLEHTQKTLHNGDFLVMVTDGVLEYLHVKNPEEKMIDFICSIQTDNAGVLAKTILDRVLLFTGGYVMDDMTILVTGIWEK